MIEDALEEQLLLLAEVDILKGLPRGEIEYVAARSRVLRLGKKEKTRRRLRERGLTAAC